MGTTGDLDHDIHLSEESGELEDLDGGYDMSMSHDVSNDMNMSIDAREALVHKSTDEIQKLCTCRTHCQYAHPLNFIGISVMCHGTIHVDMQAEQRHVVQVAAVLESVIDHGHKSCIHG